MSTNTNFNIRQGSFVFEDFILNPDGTLIKGEKKIKIPPKELAVLIILLKSAGEVVSKDTLLDKVWGSCSVSEESLTRCIYALRRILCESKDSRYIETLYSRGYRFSRPVVAVATTSPEIVKYTIAILPFQSHNEIDSNSFHNGIVQGLSKYSKFGLNILPTAITKNCNSIENILELVNHLQPDYYLAGQSVVSENGWKLSIELVRAKDHSLLHHENILLTKDKPIVELQNSAINILLQHIPGFCRSSTASNEINSPASAIMYLNGVHELYKYTPSSLHSAITIFRQSISVTTNNVLSNCALADSYLSMSQLGCFDQKRAIQQAKTLAIKAVELQHDNPQALALLGLISTLQSENVIGKALLKQAILIAPDCVHVNYYYGLQLFLNGELTQATQALDKSLTINPMRTQASALKLWITYYTQGFDDAIVLAEQQLSQYNQNNPLLQSMLALFLSLKGDFNGAKSIIQSISTSKTENSLISINVFYAQFIINGDRELLSIKKILSNSEPQISPSSLLPLYFIAYGKNETLKFWEKLKNEKEIWFKHWSQDPRLKNLHDVKS